MQRRVGQHHAQIAVLADMRQPGGPFPQQHDGPLPALEQPRLVRAHFAELPGAAEIAAHEGEGLLIPLLAPPEPPHGLRVLDAAGQMHAAEALDGRDPAVLQQRAGGGQRGLVPLGAPPLRVDKKQVRPADRTAVRLGVVAAVFNVVIFPFAVRAHGEAPHGGQRPIVGHVPHDGEARAAVGAVDEGVAVSPVLRVQQLPFTVLTEADVRRDEGVALALHKARQDRKARHPPERQPPMGFDAVDDGELRRAFRQRVQKALERGALALQLQHDAGGAVADRAAQAVFVHQPVHEGAKANALHDAVYVDPHALQGRPPVCRVDGSSLTGSF